MLNLTNTLLDARFSVLQIEIDETKHVLYAMLRHNSSSALSKQDNEIHVFHLGLVDSNKDRFSMIRRITQSDIKAQLKDKVETGQLHSRQLCFCKLFAVDKHHSHSVDLIILTASGLRVFVVLDKKPSKRISKLMTSNFTIDLTSSSNSNATATSML